MAKFIIKDWADNEILDDNFQEFEIAFAALTDLVESLYPETKENEEAFNECIGEYFIEEIDT